MKSKVERMLAFILMAIALAVPSVARQKTAQRDHLTENEADLVRENQEIEKRIEVFIKAGDRRILVLTNPGATQKKKEEEVWGPLPTGSRIELLQDFKNILAEAMEKLDSAHERSASDPQVAKALDKLKKAATRQIGELKALAPGMTDKREQRALLDAIDEADAASKGSLP